MSEVVKVSQKERDRAIILSLAMGRSIDATAKHAGVTTQIVENRLMRAGFMDKVRKERTRMATETGSWLLTWSRNAAQYLMTVMNDPNETTANRLAASKTLMAEARTWLDAAVLERLDELEQRAGVNSISTRY